MQVPIAALIQEANWLSRPPPPPPRVHDVLRRTWKKVAAEIDPQNFMETEHPEKHNVPEDNKA
jgi:hypothetical protein